MTITGIAWHLGLVLAALLVTGCDRSTNDDDPWGPGTARFTYMNTAVGQNKEVGRFSADQVEDVKVRISVLRLPARPEIIRRFVPAEIHGVPLYFVDNFAAADGQPHGGIVQDYWLNADWVLRIGTSYHRTGSRIEWMQMLSSKDALDVPLRPPYIR